MSASIVCLVALTLFALGYRFYSRYLSEVVFQLDDSEPTPAHTMADGVDYVVAPRGVLFGHHFSSIAGAAPIVGPAVAVIWGWVPALIWVVLGVITAGAVHDMATLAISLKHQGRSMGDLTAQVIGPRSRLLFLLVIFVLSVMVLAVFAFVIGALFTAYPGAIIPVNIEIPLAMFVGWFCYRKGVSLLWPSLALLVLGYVLIVYGAMTQEATRAWIGSNVTADPQNQVFIWCLLLLGYAFVTSVLPVWLLLQPRDYINSHKLLVGLALLIIGLFIVNPTIVAPAFNDPGPDSPPWFPFLFITIACGAVSGFHGLVSSGTTAKQCDKMSDARVVGYGSMLGEGTLALIATLAVTAGFASSAEWHDHFASWDAANGLKAKLGAFVTGSSHFLSGWGIPADIGQVFVAVLIISFAATSLDTATRILRFVIQELAAIGGQTWLENRYVSSLVAVGSALVMLLAASPKGPGSGGLVLWPLFGAGNQLLAGLSLLVVAIWLRRLDRNYWVALVPALFLGVMTTWSLAINLYNFWNAANWLLFVLGSAILAIGGWIVVEGAMVFGTRPTREGS
jgi:carbon starvation protein